MRDDYEVVIGLEVHVQLRTQTKLFCGCPNRFTLEPNVHVCPVCLGHPGVLPVLNREAVSLGLRASLALGCRIPETTRFDRKHYCYPDLPKNYQISQYDRPLAVDGGLTLPAEAGGRTIQIRRAHLEEDAGKLQHDASGSSVDLNRTGTPLLEIVTEPDLFSAAEARAYLEQLRLVLLYTGVSDCNMEEGSLRCDANLSLRPRGESRLGVKNEIKNMNSFRGVEAAIGKVADELARALTAGESIRQVTWGYSLERDRIFAMRTKEEANDYRYFPDPDLPPLVLDPARIEAVRAALPELPAAKQARFRTEFGLGDYDAGVLTQDPELAAYFEAVARASGLPKDSANWVSNDLARELAARGKTPAQSPLPAADLAELVRLAADRVINMPTARALFVRLLDAGGGSAKALAEREGLAQISDTGPIQEALEAAISANPAQAAEVAAGKHATAQWFIGQVMRAMKGKADPGVAVRIVAERFGLDPALFAKKK